MNRSMYSCPFYLLIALILLLMVPAAGMAQTTEGEQPAPAPVPVPVLQAQLDWFMIPVTTGTGSRVRTVPGTLFLLVKTRDDLGPVCVLEPRIRDAALQILFKTPIAINQGRLDTGGIRPRLVVAVNAVLDRNRVDDAWVITGIARKSQGAFKDLPFEEAAQCAAERDEEEKRLEQQKKIEAGG